MKIKVKCPDEIVEVVLCDVFVKYQVKCLPKLPIRSNKAKVTLRAVENKLNELASEYAHNFEKVIEEINS